MRNVALVSTNYDKNLAEIVAQAIFNVGLFGIVHLEPSVTF